MNNRTQLIIQLLGKISAAFQNFQVNEYSIQIWTEGLQEYGDQELKEALNLHIKQSVYPPTVADLIKNVEALRSHARAEKRKIANNTKLLEFSVPPEIAEENKTKVRKLLRGCVAEITKKSEGTK